MHAHCQVGARMRALARGLGALAAGIALLAAWPAAASSVTKMRVGQHPEFTRVVFELDLPAGYQVERRAADDGTPLLVVRLDATLDPGATPRVTSRSSLLESVALTSLGERTLATVRLRQSDLPVKEMILQGPPRIVLDVLGRDTALVQKPAARPAPRPAVARAPAPAPKAEPEPRPEPAPVPPEPEPEAAAPAPPKPQPAQAREAVPSRPRPPAAEPEPAPAAEPEAVAELPPRDVHAEEVAREAMERRLASVREAAEKRQRQLQAEREVRRQAETPTPAAPGGEVAPPTPEPTGPSGPSLSPLLLAGGVVLAVLLAVLAIALVRRRRAAEDEVDIDEIGEAAGPIARPPEDAGASEPLIGGPEPLFRGPTKQAPLGAPGLFEEPEKGDQAMETQAHEMEAASAARSRGGSDVARLVAELERRISHLEAGLEAANSARERLERQVAAQSEELRVQRAAIARTQRALRGLSRSDEEQATEPALRD